MGAFRADTGARLSKTEMTALFDASTPDPTYTAQQEILVDHELYDGELEETGERTARRVLVPAGAVLTKAQLDALFEAATITGIDPATGDAGGGDTVTITGTELDGTTSVTFGGVDGTDLEVLSPEEITVVTPAGSAGAVDVEVLDDSGSVTETDGFTYA